MAKKVQLLTADAKKDVLHPETSSDVVLLSDGRTSTQKLTDINNELNRKLSLTGGTLTGALTAPTFNGALNGNASTATKLQTARQINGVAFDGTKNITIKDDTKLPLTGGTINGKLTVTDGIDVSDKKLYNVQAIQSNGKEYLGDDGLGNIHVNALGEDIRLGYGSNTKRIVFHKPQVTNMTYKMLINQEEPRLKIGVGYDLTKEKVDELVAVATASCFRNRNMGVIEGLYGECESYLTVNTDTIMAYLVDMVLYLYDELHQLKSKEMN